MNALKKTVAAAVLAATCSPSFAAPGDPPAGWTFLSGASTSNVKLYKKNNVEVYAQVVDMVAGAKVELKQIYTGMATSPFNGLSYKGYQRNSVATWYANAGPAVSVVNGDYFAETASASTALLSFGVRANGSLVDSGSDPVNNRQIEFFTGQGAYVTTATASRLTSGPAQNIVGGLSPSSATSAGLTRGRTGLCTLVPSNPSRLFLILSHKSATQATVNSDFATWGCNSGSEIMMDGSASAQLRANGVVMDGVAANNATGRTVPQVIIIRNN